MKNKQYLVFGLGRFGSSMARALCAQGQEVLAVDSDQELVNQIAPHVTQAMQLDATDETRRPCVRWVCRISMRRWWLLGRTPGTAS